MCVSLPPFQRFLDAHRDDVWRFLAASVGPDAADDCFQETFLSAMRAYPRLRPDSNPRAWVLTIAHRKALDHHRARKRHAVPVATVPDVAVPAESEPTDGVWERVRELPPKQRAALLLSRIDGLAYRDVADALGCTEGAVKALLFRATQSLKKGLHEFLQED